jgi:hypothetical protein
MTASLKRYRQVWLDWLHWPPFRVLIWVMIFYWVVLAPLVFVFFLEQFFHVRSRPFISNIFFGSVIVIATQVFFLTPVVLLGIVPTLVVWRVRSQMQGWRAAVIPGYRRPHLLISAFIVFVIVLIMGVIPLGLSFAAWSVIYRFSKVVVEQSAWQTAAVLSQALFLAVAFGWLMAWLSPLLVVSIVIGCILLLFTGAFSFFEHVAELQHAEIPRFYALDALLFLELWLRLGQISGRDKGLSVDERMPWLSDLFVKLDAPPAGGLICAGVWRRARHRRLLGLGHRFIWLVAIYAAAVIAMAPALGGGGRWLVNLEYASTALLVAGIISTVGISLSWPQRIAALGDIELLRPATRALFAREIGLAMLADTVEISAASFLAMLAPIYYWSPAALQNPHFWLWAATLLLAQVLVYGMLVWSMNRTFNMTVLGVMAVLVWSAVILIDANFGRYSLSPALVAAGAGVVLSASAYRRWLRPDLT